MKHLFLFGFLLAALFFDLYVLPLPEYAKRTWDEIQQVSILYLAGGILGIICDVVRNKSKDIDK